MIPYGRQDIQEEDILAVVDTLHSDFLTQGPKTSHFESAVKRYTGAQYAVACNSATSGLHIACLALGLGSGDILWTSPNSFVSSANCARFCGAEVDFIDIDESTGNLCLTRLSEQLERAKARGKLPKIIVAVHFAGQPCDLKGLSALRDRYGFKIIEDAAHAIGADFEGEPVGACNYSDMCVFSFHPVKVITAAEGGMVTCNSPELEKRMRRLVSHGVTRDPDEYLCQDEGPWSYQQTVLGFNYRMSDVHASLGLSQLRRLDQYVAKRNVLAERYDNALSLLPLTPLRQSENNINAFHLYVVVLDKKLDRLAVYNAMRAEGIGVQVHYIPIYKQPYYQRLGFSATYCEHTERYYKGCLSLPLYPAMDAKDQDKVIDILEKVVNNSRLHSCTGE